MPDPDRDEADDDAGEPTVAMPVPFLDDDPTREVTDCPPSPRRPRARAVRRARVASIGPSVADSDRQVRAIADRWSCRPPHRRSTRPSPPSTTSTTTSPGPWPVRSSTGWPALRRPVPPAAGRRGDRPRPRRPGGRAADGGPAPANGSATPAPTTDDRGPLNGRGPAAPPARPVASRPCACPTAGPRPASAPSSSPGSTRTSRRANGRPTHPGRRATSPSGPPSGSGRCSTPAGWCPGGRPSWAAARPPPSSR